MKLKDIRANPLADNTCLLSIVVEKGQNNAIQQLLSNIGTNYNEWVLDISKLSKPKSKDANSYMWILCDKIAKKIGKTTKEDIYRSAIREVGMFEDVPIKNDEVKAKIELWTSIGDGWFAEEQRDSKLNGYTLVRRYFGSRIYDNYNMCFLVDYVVEAAEAQGIDTRTPDEIEHMKNLWKK
ncbi:MAG TPA: hypothetical protein VFD03_01210 [Clostridia bacterium]|nr:hypothetical protein [Clostridia bacterium]